MAARSVWVCGRLFAGIVGSNPVGGGMYMSFVNVVCGDV